MLSARRRLATRVLKAGAGSHVGKDCNRTTLQKVIDQLADEPSILGKAEKSAFMQPVPRSAGMDSKGELPIDVQLHPRRGVVPNHHGRLQGAA